MVGEDQEAPPAPPTVLHSSGDARRLERHQGCLLELLQHGHKSYATDSRFRLTSSSNISLKLRMARRPAGRAAKTIRDTATVMAKAMVSLPSRLGHAFSQGRKIKTAESEQRAA